MKTIDLKFGTSAHTRVVNAVKARKEMSEDRMKDRHAQWNKAEEDFNAFVEKTAVEKQRDQERDTSGRQSYTKIIVPQGYSMLMTAHTYFASTLLSRDPIFQYTGAHGEPEMNVTAVESLTAYQMRYGSNTAVLYLWLMDVAKYGLGVTCNYWEEEMHYVGSFEEQAIEVAGIPLEGASRRVQRTKEIPGYEGNRLFNVSVYDYLPDPRVPLTQPNDGEFGGRKIKLCYNDIVTAKLQGRYIEANAEKVLERMRSRKTSDAGSEHSPHFDAIGDDTFVSTVDPKTGLSAQIPAVEMVVEIIPKLWGLGQSEYPQKWVFIQTDEKQQPILLSARPYGMFHNRFPYHALEMEMDAYAQFKRGMLDIGRPMNEVMNWLFNSHFYNVERSLNGEIVYDPSMVRASDVLDPKAGKRIALKPSAYGRDVRTAIHSLSPDAAVTQGNLRDMGVVAELLQQSMGINEGMLGNLPSGRQSATASRIATTASTSRLKTIVDYFSATGFQSLALNMLQTAQQMYSTTQKFRIAGDLPNNAEGFVEINPEMIAGSFDYVPVDGSMPIDRVATVNMWTQLLNQFRQSPQLAAQYDIGKIIGWIMQQGGIRNLKQFKVQEMAPEVIAAKMARGELEQVGEPNGDRLGSTGGYGRPAGTTEDAERAASQLPNPGQSGGLGRTV